MKIKLSEADKQALLAVRDIAIKISRDLYMHYKGIIELYERAHYSEKDKGFIVEASEVVKEQMIKFVNECKEKAEDKAYFNTQEFANFFNDISNEYKPA